MGVGYDDSASVWIWWCMQWFEKIYLETISHLREALLDRQCWLQYSLKKLFVINFSGLSSVGSWFFLAKALLFEMWSKSFTDQSQWGSCFQSVKTSIVWTHLCNISDLTLCLASFNTDLNRWHWGPLSQKKKQQFNITLRSCWLHSYRAASQLNNWVNSSTAGKEQQPRSQVLLIFDI